MYRIKKRIEVCGAHNLTLSYESKCKQLHGHNWIIEIYLQAEELDENGMVLDFTHIKEKITSKLDHKYLNDLFSFNPTAENIAKWICDEIGDKCYRVTVQESEGNIAEFIR